MDRAHARARVAEAGLRRGATTVVLLLAFNIIMFATAELPLLGFVVAGDRTRVVVERFGSAVRAHQRQVVIGMALVFGVYLVVKGLHEALG